MQYYPKTICKQLIVALMLVFCSTGIASAQEEATYEVKPGDTLYGISKKLDVTISELKQWNNLQNNEIELGQELVYYIREESQEEQEEVPSAENTGESLVGQSSSSTDYYLVKSGDTLYQIAEKHNMTLEELKQLNDLQSNNIRVGQQLSVKKQSVAPSVVRFAEESTPQGLFTVYEVKSGDGISSLLNRFKMTRNELEALNPETDLQNLRGGQEITVLLPPSRRYKNPYLEQANLQDLGSIPVKQYQSSEEGETTTNGELYDPDALTAAHSNMALGSIVFVENPETGNGIYVRINDRITGSGLKLSQQAYRLLKLDQVTKPQVTVYKESE